MIHYEARRHGEGEGRRGLEGKKTGDERGGEREREKLHWHTMEKAASVLLLPH